MKPAPLAPLDQVEWRVDSEPYDRNGKTTCRFVPYIDAALIAKLLDEWVGPENWSDKYEVATVAGKEAMWCTLGVRCGEAGWVTHTDIGEPSNMAAQKGAVSDAFKRAACLKWGVGRNVYDLPTLYARCRTVTGGGKTRAAADGKATLDDLLRQLKVLGFDVDGGKVADSPPEGVDAATGEIAAPPATAARTTARACVVCKEPITGKAVKGGGGFAHEDCTKPADNPNEEPF